MGTGDDQSGLGEIASTAAQLAHAETVLQETTERLRLADEKIADLSRLLTESQANLRMAYDALRSAIKQIPSQPPPDRTG
jgi:hypothetical protein